MRLKYKLWLGDNSRVFGEGPSWILYQIDQLGSLQKAADSFNMSYSKAWGIIRRVEERIGCKLLHTRIGGRTGGGSTLTREGRLLMNQYLSFKKEADETLDRLEEKWFNEDFWKRLNNR